MQVTPEVVRLRRKAAAAVEHFTQEAIEGLKRDDDREFLQGECVGAVQWLGRVRCGAVDVVR